MAERVIVRRVIERIVSARVVVDRVAIDLLAHMIGYDIDHEVHASVVQSSGKGFEIGWRAKVRVDAV